MISWFQTSDPTSHSISGRVQTACWSPCGSVLLFATDADSVIYAVNLGDDDSTAAAVPVADVSSVECEVDGEVME